MQGLIYHVEYQKYIPHPFLYVFAYGGHYGKSKSKTLSGFFAMRFTDALKKIHVLHSAKNAREVQKSRGLHVHFQGVAKVFANECPKTLLHHIRRFLFGSIIPS